MIMKRIQHDFPLTKHGSTGTKPKFILIFLKFRPHHEIINHGLTESL